MADSKEPAHDNDKLGTVHHYVPQGYLRRFALIDRPEQIYAYEIGKEPYPTNVHNIAGQRDFYTYTNTETGVSDSRLENVLADVDAQGIDALRVLDGLQDGFIELPKPHREHLLTYIAFQHTRNLQERKVWATMYEQSTTMFMQMAASDKDSYHSTAREALGDMYMFDTTEATRKTFLAGEAKITFDPLDQYFMGNALDMSKELYKILYVQKKMALVSKTDDAGVFVTSDNPVTHYLLEEQRKRMHPILRGTGYTNAIFQLPISPSRCLLFINKDMIMDTFTYDQDAVDYINFHTYHLADRWIFSNVRDTVTVEHFKKFKRTTPFTSISSPFNREA